MKKYCVHSDLENLAGLSSKWSTLIHPKPTFPHVHNSIPCDSDGSFDFQLNLAHDYRNDLAGMRSLITSIVINGYSRNASTKLAKVATALHLSHISFSTVTEVLIALQEIGRVTGRVSKHFTQTLTQLNQSFVDFRNFSGAAELAVRMRRTDNKLLQNFSDAPPIGNTDTITKRKIAKYLEAIECYRSELEAAEVFLLCPSVTSSAFTSPKGIGPLPHQSLLAFSTIIDIEDARQSELLQKLTGIYGPGSFMSQCPLDKIKLMNEIENLQLECRSLECQLRKVSGDPQSLSASKSV